MLPALLSSFVQMEKRFISGRTKSAIVKSKYDNYLDTIEELLNKKVPILSISKIIDIGTRQSLTNYIKSRKLKKQLLIC